MREWQVREDFTVGLDAEPAGDSDMQGQRTEWATDLRTEGNEASG